MLYTEHDSETYKSMISISVEAMKSLLLVNGGAVIAVLSYLGAINNPAIASQAGLPLGLFVAGVVFNIFTFVGSYLTQYALFNESMSPGKYTGTKHQTFLYLAFVFFSSLLVKLRRGLCF